MDEGFNLHLSLSLSLSLSLCLCNRRNPEHLVAKLVNSTSHLSSPTFSLLVFKKLENLEIRFPFHLFFSFFLNLQIFSYICVCEELESAKHVVSQEF
jgi:hypothetical protein